MFKPYPLRQARQKEPQSRLRRMVGNNKQQNRSTNTRNGIVTLHRDDKPVKCRLANGRKQAGDHLPKRLAFGKASVDCQGAGGKLSQVSKRGCHAAHATLSGL